MLTLLISIKSGDDEIFPPIFTIKLCLKSHKKELIFSDITVCFCTICETNRYPVLSIPLYLMQTTFKKFQLVFDFAFSIFTCISYLKHTFQLNSALLVCLWIYSLICFHYLPFRNPLQTSANLHRSCNPPTSHKPGSSLILKLHIKAAHWCEIKIHVFLGGGGAWMVHLD